MTFPISKSFPLLAIAAAAVLAAGCASNASKSPESAQAQAPAAAAPAAAQPMPVDLCADATDPAPAKKGAKPAPLSSAQVAQLAGKGTVAQARRNLVGKTVQVCVTKSDDAGQFEVKGDDLRFVCKSSAPSFAGGQITAKVTALARKEGQTIIDVDRCEATNAAAQAPAAPSAPVAAAAPAKAPAAAAPAAAAPAATGQAKPGMDARGNVIDPTKVESGSGRTIKGLNDWEGEITGNPVPGSKFDQLQIGMSMRQVTNIVGEPTDSGAYITGKAFIPFFMGSDRARMELTYKGKGRLIFAAGSGFGGATGGNLIWIIHSANEPGYR